MTSPQPHHPQRYRSSASMPRPAHPRRYAERPLPHATLPPSRASIHCKACTTADGYPARTHAYRQAKGCNRQTIPMSPAWSGVRASPATRAASSDQGQRRLRPSDPSECGSTPAWWSRSERERRRPTRSKAKQPRDSVAPVGVNRQRRRPPPRPRSATPRACRKEPATPPPCARTRDRAADCCGHEA
jgi:hypothetical protein